MWRIKTEIELYNNGLVATGTRTTTIELSSSEIRVLIFWFSILTGKFLQFLMCESAQQQQRWVRHIGCISHVWHCKRNRKKKKQFDWTSKWTQVQMAEIKVKNQLFGTFDRVNWKKFLCSSLRRWKHDTSARIVQGSNICSIFAASVLPNIITTNQQDHTQLNTKFGHNSRGSMNSFLR